MAQHDVKIGDAQCAREALRPFDEAKRILAKGLMPIIEPEVSIKSPERDAADRLMLNEILKQLDALPEGERVMLKLTLPTEAGLFQPLIDHPKVLRVVALSGGFSREEACTELAKNPGMIASFSRALLSDLRADQATHSGVAALIPRPRPGTRRRGSHPGRARPRAP